MLKLKFNLRHQDIQLVNKGAVVATDSKDYLVAKFNTISDDWETPLTAIFTDDKHQQPYAVIVGADSELEENECFVPWEVLTDECNVYVSVYCGNLHTTVTAAFKVRKSGYVDGETPPPPSPTVYDTIIQALQDLDNGKQDKLTAGENIEIDANGTISASGRVTSYNDLTDKPSINGFPINGDIQLQYHALDYRKLGDYYYLSLDSEHIFSYGGATEDFRDRSVSFCYQDEEHGIYFLPTTEDGFIFRFPNNYTYYDEQAQEIKHVIHLYFTFTTSTGKVYLRHDTKINEQEVRGEWQELCSGGSQYTLTEQDKEDIANIVIQKMQGSD